MHTDGGTGTPGTVATAPWAGASELWKKLHS